jgi:2-isopropylmalate synthase
MHVPPNKAIVGANAFAHEAGIHQDGVLKNRLTYEIMSAETVGLDGTTLVLGKHSGRHALRTRLEELGYTLPEDEFRQVFSRFKELADKKKVVDDRDIEALVLGESRRPAAIYVLEQVQVSCGTHAIPTATVRMRGPGETVKTESAQGTGPVDAVCKAINKVVGEPGELVEFAVNAITEGIDAVGEVTIHVQEYGSRTGNGTGNGHSNGNGHTRKGPRIFSGYGVNTDILVAAAEAYVAALNQLFHARQEHRRPVPANAPALAVDLFGNSVWGAPTSASAEV